LSFPTTKTDKNRQKRFKQVNINWIWWLASVCIRHVEHKVQSLWSINFRSLVTICYANE
jgi:hypothetical protein